ncbi:Cox11p [Sugiyamaella lignohabitans]|uniref:Cox11p n=1 Tax=Sugiyamaella lignohabitans TaxID=796027 RepID=A0A167DTB2_9ASCO|nr:Cox11p [Sugiyamaella lignohabitans]ANB13271.1 Cox11p [Sugiyamaella lignohabitans]
MFRRPTIRLPVQKQLSRHLSSRSMFQQQAKFTDQQKREAFLRGIQQANQARNKQKNKKVLTVSLYSASIVVAALALSYASVPLYRVICQRTGWGGTPITNSEKFTADKMIPVERKKRISVTFSSEVSGAVPWTFKPQQREVQVLPGETALAFYKAKNISDTDIIGMATYSVVPEKVAPYFSKIQCFCFEEQMLRAGEEVDMPVFFFIDPDFAKDPSVAKIDDIVLHYTFFKAQYNENGTLSPVDQSQEQVSVAAARI